MKKAFLFSMIVFCLFATDTDLAKEKYYYYYKDGKKYYFKKNTKKIKLYKINSKDPQKIDKIYVKELIVAKEKNANDKVNFDKFYAKIVTRAYISNKTNILETKYIPGFQINFNNTQVRTDGKNYSYQEQSNDFSYGVFFGFEQYGSFLEVGALKTLEEKEFELNLGLMVNPLSFRVLTTEFVPTFRLGGGFSYKNIRSSKSPDSFFLNGATGFLIGTQNVKFELLGFYKVKFYDEIKLSYGTLDRKETKVGFEIAARYLF